MQRLASRVWRVAIFDHGEDSHWCHGVVVVVVHVGGELWMVWLIQVASLKSGDGNGYGEGDILEDDGLSGRNHASVMINGDGTYLYLPTQSLVDPKF